MSPLEALLAPFALRQAKRLLDAVLGATAQRIKRKFKPGECQRALEGALVEGLKVALNSFPFDQVEREDCLELFEELLARPNVVEELARLLDPHHGETLDLDLLQAEFADVGFELDELFDFSFKDFLRRFVSAFYDMASRQPALQNVIEFNLLRGIAERMGDVGEATKRTAEATEHAAERLDEISNAAIRLIKGQASANELGAAIHRAIEQGFARILSALEALTASLHGEGLDVKIDQAGRVVIDGDAPAGPTLDARAVRELQAAISELRGAVEAHTPTPEELDALEVRYCQHLIRWFERLTFQGMMRTARPISLSLEEVYVELRSVAEVPEAADAFSIEERRLLQEVGEDDSETRRELLHQLDSRRRERWSRALPERKPLAEALYASDRRATVVLGDPGSGKTTLLHLLALVHARSPEAAQEKLRVSASEADRLPIFVPLAAFDAMLRETPGLTLVEFLPRYYDRRRGLAHLDPLFRRALESGRALLLLDGLDEVRDMATRSYVVQQASALIGEWTARGVRVVLTSRFIGYRAAPLPGDLPHLSVLDFGLSEIETFVHQWTHAYERWVAGGAETPEVLRLAQAAEVALLADVSTHPGVQRLAANPLMLTMLALLRRQVGPLPRRRISLYRRYTETMIEAWVEARTPGEREVASELLDLREVESILISLALWLQREKASGTAGRVEIEGALTTIYLEEAGHDAATADRRQLREAGERAGRFLREMRHLTGLIVERGYDAFGFLHLTFQEYFTGRALARLDDEARWEVVRPHRHDARWREPILLCAGWLGVVENNRPRVTGFVRRLLDCHDNTEADLHRDLLLALAVAGDDVNLEPALLAEMVEQAVACLSTNVYELAGAVMQRLGQLVVNGAAAAEVCFAPVWESGDSQLRRAAVTGLAGFVSNSGVRAALLAWLGDDDEGVRAAAAEALGSAVSDAAVRAALLARLGDDREDVRYAAAVALGGAVGEEVVQSALLARLGDDKWGVRAAAAEALGSAVSDAAVRAALLARLGDDNEGVRAATAVTLGGAVGEEVVQSALLARLDDDKWGVRYAVAWALGGAVGDAAVQSALLARLDSDGGYVRAAAAVALGGAVGEEAVRSTLLALLGDDDEDVRYAAAEALGGAVGEEAVRAALLARLGDDDESVRRAAAEALGGAVSDAAVQSALLALLGDNEWFVRWAAVEALGGAVSDAAVRAALLARLGDDNEGVRRAAARALGGAGDYPVISPSIYEELRRVMLGDVNPDVRNAAYTSLVRLAGAGGRPEADSEG